MILEKTEKSAKIFDAGGESYSMILPWLFLYGYNNLMAGNLSFQKPFKQGSIIYQHEDITKTTYSDDFFDAITCLSVIEHGVDLDNYFCEMSRILKTGGVLITSTDYYETPIDTMGKEDFGCPIKIFNKDQIIEALEIAKRYGFKLTSPIDLNSEDKVVLWKKFNFRYTFIVFSLQKCV